MDLVIDIGNSYIKCAIFAKNKLQRFYSFKTSKNISLKSLQKEKITGVAISSVVPNLTPIVINKIKAFSKAPIFDIALAKEQIKILPIIKKKNRNIGSDLIADLVAADKIYGSPAIVFDIGTASKVLALNKNGVFVGAAFFPGVSMGVRALFNETSALPLVELADSRDVIGVDTIACIKCGIINSIKYTIKGFTNDYKKILGKQAKTIVTGGGASYIKNSLGDYIYNPFLTLYGIYFIYKGALR